MGAKKTKQLSITDKKVLKTIGTRVKHLREQRKLSVFDITGDDMPIRSRQHWQRIEAGQKNFNVITLFKLAKTLDVKPEELLRIA